jgi:hypothetical protein
MRRFMVVLFTFNCSGDVEVSKTLSIHGIKVELLFENHMEYLGHGVGYNAEMYCRKAVCEDMNKFILAQGGFLWQDLG